MPTIHVNNTFVEVKGDDAPGRVRSASDTGAAHGERECTDAVASAENEGASNFKTFDPFQGDPKVSMPEAEDEIDQELAELERQMHAGEPSNNEQHQQLAFATFDPMATFDPDAQVQEFAKSLRINAAPGLEAQIQQEAYKTFDAFELGHQAMPAMQVGMPEILPMPGLPVIHMWHHVPMLVQIAEERENKVVSEPAAVEKPVEVSASTAKNKLAAQDGRTTVMMRNLPPNLTRAMLLVLIDSHGFSGDYNFLYVPIDFVKQVALGYAFVDLISCDKAVQFWKIFDRFRGWPSPSKKVCRLSWSAPCQGLESHIERYRNSPLMHPDVPDEVRPVLFVAGSRVAFPSATVQLKAPRLKASHRLQAFWSKEKEEGDDTKAAAQQDAQQDADGQGPWADVVDIAA